MAGKYLELLTNGTIPPCIHRVIINDTCAQDTGGGRLSAPFFLRPIENVFTNLTKLCNNNHNDDQNQTTGTGTDNEPSGILSRTIYLPASRIRIRNGTLNTQSKSKSTSHCRRRYRILLWVTLPPQPMWTRPQSPPRSSSHTTTKSFDQTHHVTSTTTRRSNHTRTSPTIRCFDLDPAMTVSNLRLVYDTEQHVMEQQAQLAWYATLGGGYFFCFVCT